MLRIKFKNDADVLARVMISKSMMPKKFAHYLWDNYKISYSLLIKDIKSNEINNNIILELQQQDFFKISYEKAKKNLERIQNNWEKNSDRINLFLNKIFKKEFTLDSTAIIVPPSLNTGTSIGNNQIVWGHVNGVNDENYDLVYLVHESLHSYFFKNDLTHTIIENIADIELAKFLNKTNSYEGHPDLKPMHIKILPFWNIYLNKKQEDIVRENKINNIAYNLKDFVEYKTKIKNLNIDEFVEFLEKLNLDKLLDIKSSYTIYKKS